MRLGLDEEARKLKEIDRKICVSRERIRQIKKKLNSRTSFEPLS